MPSRDMECGQGGNVGPQPNGSRLPIGLPIYPGPWTAKEAFTYLRLDESRDDSAALKALNRLVDKGLIRPCIVGKKRRYTRKELDRFLDSQTERYGDVG